MDEKSIPLVPLLGHYAWIVMTFGLRHAPQIFQRRIVNILKDLSNYCPVYIDDHGIILGKNDHTCVEQEIGF